MSVAFIPTKPLETLFVDPLAHKKVSCKFSSIEDAQSCNNVTELVLKRLSSPKLEDPMLIISFKNSSLADFYDENKDFYYLTQKTITDLTDSCKAHGFTVSPPLSLKDPITDGNNQLIISVPPKSEKKGKSATSDLVSVAQKHLQANTDKLHKDKLKELSQIVAANENKFSYKLPFPPVGISHTVKEWITGELVQNGYEILSTESDLVFSKIDAVQVRIIKELKEQSKNISQGEYKVGFTSPTPIISKETLEEEFGEEFKTCIRGYGDDYEITISRADIAINKMIQELNQKLKTSREIKTYAIYSFYYNSYELNCLEDGLKSLGLTFSKTDDTIIVVNPHFEIKEALKIISPTLAITLIAVISLKSLSLYISNNH